MTNQVDINLVISVGSIAINLFMTVIMLRLKVELAEIKIWILENFERRVEKTG